jgi:hypothetical protein
MRKVRRKESDYSREKRKKAKKKKKSKKREYSADKQKENQINKTNNIENEEPKSDKQRKESTEKEKSSEIKPEELTINNKLSSKTPEKIESKSPNKSNSECKKVKQTTPLMTFPKSNYKRDCTKNMSYFDTKDQRSKIKMRIIIPEYIVSHLQQKEHFLKDLETKNKCKFAFIEDRENCVSTCEGIKGQLVQFGGSLKRVMNAIQELLSGIKTIEQELNGKRKS